MEPTPTSLETSAQHLLPRSPLVARCVLPDAPRDRNRMAQLLAKTFFREMVAVGFDSAQIVVAATTVISQLSESFARRRMGD